MLSVNEQIPNGSIPDVVFPFKLSKADARTQIDKFVNKRKFLLTHNLKKSLQQKI